MSGAEEGGAATAAVAASDALSQLFDFTFEEFRACVESFSGLPAGEIAAAEEGSSSSSTEGSSDSSSSSSTESCQNSCFHVLRVPADVLQALAAAVDLQQLQEEASSSSSVETAAAAEAQGSERRETKRAAELSRRRQQQDTKTAELLLCMRLCARLAERFAIFSPNEDLDDIPTKHLKYLLLPYLLGRLSLECNDMQRRLSRMQEAQIYLREFMAAAERLRVGRGEDHRAFDVALEQLQQQSSSSSRNREESIRGEREEHLFSGGMPAAAAARNELIARAKYEKQLTAKLATLFERRQAAAQQGEEEADEEERELWMCLLARAVAASPTHLSLMAREIPMLLLRAQQEEEQLRVKRAAAETGAAAAAARRTLQRTGGVEEEEKKKKPWFYVVRDRSELRQLYRDKVFTPGHNLPTMSLAECAAIEMEMEVNQIGAGRKNEVVREFSTTQSRVEADEEEERQQREWDNWKDENPRGSGNKLRNKG